MPQPRSQSRLFTYRNAQSECLRRLSANTSVMYCAETINARTPSLGPRSIVSRRAVSRQDNSHVGGVVKLGRRPETSVMCTRRNENGGSRQCSFARHYRSPNRPPTKTQKSDKIALRAHTNTTLSFAERRTE